MIAFRGYRLCSLNQKCKALTVMMVQAQLNVFNLVEWTSPNFLILEDKIQ